MTKRPRPAEATDLTGRLPVRVARTAYLWFCHYLLHQLLVAAAIVAVAVWGNVPDRFVFLATPVPSVALVLHLWGARAWRQGSQIVVRNGTFARTESLSTSGLRVSATTKVLFGLSEGGTMPVPFLVLTDTTSGRRVKVTASALPTRKQRDRFWNALAPRLHTEPAAYSIYRMDS